jgi:hypothetical protein
VKAVSDLNCPIAGEIVEANDALDQNPGLVNEDPMARAGSSDCARTTPLIMIRCSTPRHTSEVPRSAINVLPSPHAG